MNIVQQIKEDLLAKANQAKAISKAKFFQSYPDGYGEGDEFIGVTVPTQRDVSKKYYRDLNLSEIEMFLNEPVHEYRLTALFMLVLIYQKAANDEIREDIVNIYLKNIERVNNWDLVDSSAHLILGPHLFNRDRGLLYELAQSPNLWLQRISIIATYHFIRNRQFEDSLLISEMLLNHKHDLIHKAVGWMLREIGNRDFDMEYSYLVQHYRRMPRTMLRYAIEKFPEDIRQGFLKGTV